jgi:hypothetical protein
MNNAIRTALGFVAFACLASGAGAQKAYKYVDDKGNVTYSQVPPTAKDAAKVDITPAHKGSGGTRQPHYPGSGYSEGAQYQHHEMRANAGRSREEAQQKRIAALEAECNRSRGSDCKNPETLRYLEQQNVPRPIGPGRR